ncbi:MAG TPA: hypothetical protein VI434_11095 [Candidatus Dormibacteraeota bacterium]
MSLSIWVPGGRDSAPWLVVAIAFMVPGSLIVLVAGVSARRPEKQPNRLPIDDLLQRHVTWVAMRNRANHYSTDADRKQWELAIQQSEQGTRYIITSDGRAVREIAYCPDVWLLEPMGE